MRKIMLVGGLLSLVLSLTWCWPRPGQRTLPYTPLGPGVVYVALGDSLAAGFTVSRPADAYVARIAAELGRTRPIEVRNFSVPGETSTSLLQWQLPQAIEFIRARRRAGKRVSPITVDIGGNDARDVGRATDPARRETITTIESNIGTALDALIAATGGDRQRTADIAVMTYYNPYPGDPHDETTPAYWSAQLNAAITRAAQRRGVAIADVAGAFDGGKVYRYTYIATGDIHANSDGHRLIAERFLEALGYNESR